VVNVLFDAQYRKAVEEHRTSVGIGVKTRQIGHVGVVIVDIGYYSERKVKH
jgi:hypothetical protein